MKYKGLFVVAALCYIVIIGNVQGAWNPNDLRGSLVISKITKAESLAYEIGQCSTIYLYPEDKQGEIPNKPAYQTPYALYYSAPPIANIKALFKDNKLTIRPAQFEKCTTQDTEPYFTIELPPAEPNIIKLRKVESLGTYVTLFNLEKLQSYLTNKTQYLTMGHPFKYYIRTGNPWTTFMNVIRQEQNGYFYIHKYDDVNPQLTFIEVSIDLAIDYVPDEICSKYNYKFCGFGYIPTVNVRHIILQPKILDLLKYSTPSQYISSPKAIASAGNFQIPLETLIDEGILQQFVE